MAHYDITKIGKHISEIFGTEEVRASRNGNWIARENTVEPATGAGALRVWVMEYAGMIFGSGWFGEETES